MSYWPAQFRRTLNAPSTTLAYNLTQAAARYADVPAIHFLGRTLSYREFANEVEAFAGGLQQLGIRRGDRVVLYLQNSVQWLVAYFGALRADAVVVPVNPMNRSAELHHVLRDSGARAAVCAQELVAPLQAAAKGCDLLAVVVATYGDYLPAESPFVIPNWLREPAKKISGTIAWRTLIDQRFTPNAACASPDDLCLLPYTSGSTGLPKGCMHTHRTFMHNIAGLALWHGLAAGDPCLGVAPMYHVAGLAHSVNVPVFAGATLVVMPRWERRLAASLIAHYRVVHASVAPTAIIDLLAEPQLEDFDLSSLRRLTAGGAAMPDEVWQQLHDRLGLPFIEAYGMTEAAATTHNNPVYRPKRQCLGVPFFDTHACVIDPDTLRTLPVGESGEILVRGPQLFKGYWNRAEETAAAFAQVDGETWYRTGDIGYVDEEGYYFMTDRLKRMINASGFKVWPAELETVLYRHPAVLEACVIASPDAYRGETVKALIVLRDPAQSSLTPADLIAWMREQVAAYKVPRRVEFVDSLPKSPVGKILWRELQDAERQPVADSSVSSAT